jgi:hypothetical protein
MLRSITVFMLLLIFLSGAGLSQIPQTMSYQGVLRDGSGVIVPNDDYNLTLRIYNTSSGGTALWTEAQSVTVTDGIFNVILGSVQPLNLAFDIPYWLGITVGTGSELSPRIQLTSAAYSLNSNSVVNNAVTSAKIADGAVTTAKINDGAVTQVKLDPGISLPPGGTAGGDLTGTYPNPTIATNAVTTTKINDGAVTQAKLAPGVSLPPGGTAGGDLSGTYPNPVVDGLQGRAVSSTLPTSGQVLKWNGSSWVPGTDDSGGAPSGSAGGDLTGTYPNPTIAANAITSSKIQDLQVASADLANQAVTTAKIADGAVTQAKLGTGVTLPPSGTAGGDLSGTYPNPTVDGLQNRAVSSTAPTSGQVLKWNGSSWAPDDDNAGTSVWATSGNDIYNTNTDNVGIGISSPISKLHVSGSSTGNVAVFRNNIAAGTGAEISVSGPESPTALALVTSNAAGSVSGVAIDFNGTQSGGTARTSGRISGFLTNPASATEGALTFHTRSSGILTERMRINGDGNIILSPYNGVLTERPIYHNYSASMNALNASGTTSLAMYYIENNYAGNGWGLSAGMNSSSASTSSYGVYGFNYGTGYGVYGRNYNSGGIGARGINNSVGNYGDLGTPSYGVYGYHNTGNYGYIGSSNYGSYGYLASTNVGDYGVYGYGPHTSGVDGTGYGPFNTLGGVKGYCFWGNPYTFGVAGYSYLDYNRSGGCFGSNYSGTIWGAMGYRTETGALYGGYFTSLFVVPGDLSNTGSTATNIGLGSWGDLFGADIHGRIYGLYAEGNNYALYTNGAAFKNNLDVHLQDTQSSNMAVLYTNVSTDVTVQTSGYTTLSGGEALIEFDDNFKKVVSSEIPIVVTVTPMGECRGVYVAKVDRNGFRVVENNKGESSVEVSFIAIGRRAGYERPQLPPEVIASDYVDKLARGLHNDGDTQSKGEGLYYENGQLLTGIHSSTLPPSKPSEDPGMIKMAVPEKSGTAAPQGDGAAPEAEQKRQQQR